MHPRSWSLPLDLVTVICDFRCELVAGKDEMTIKGMLLAGVGFWLIMAREHYSRLDWLLMRGPSIICMADKDISERFIPHVPCSGVELYAYRENAYRVLCSDTSSWSRSEMKDWPPSNYPIFLALLLLAATAVTLAMGDEPRAENLAIYAYYLLVIGVTIRFFELSLPESTLQRLGLIETQISGSMIRLIQGIKVLTQKVGNLRIPRINIPNIEIPHINLPKIKIFHINIPHTNIPFIKMPQINLPKINMPHIKMPYTKHLRQNNLEKESPVIADVSRNVVILLSLFFIISLIYGLMINWLVVTGYIYDLILVIFGFFALHVFTRGRS